MTGVLGKRVATAVVLGALLLAATLLLPTRLFALVIGVVVVAAAQEWGRLAGLSPGATLAYAALVAVLGVAMVVVPGGFDAAFVTTRVALVCGAATLFWALCAFPWVVARWPMRGRRALMAAIGVLVLCATWLALVQLHARSPWTMLAAMGLVFVADTAAYFAGRRFGRRKLAPQVSPGKTWEGAAGAALAVAAYAWVVFPLVAGPPAAALPAGCVIALALLLLAFSIVGDLFESWLKREAGVKDSGALLPGHGGVLDRVDALLAAMPPAALAAGAWIG